MKDGVAVSLASNAETEKGADDAVSQAAASRKRWEFMLMIAPLPIPRGTGSPVNPIAMF